MNTIHVIRREYIEHVRKKSFLIGTILAPLFMVAFLVVPILLTFFQSDEQLSVAIIDHTGEVAVRFASAFKDTTEDGKPKYVFQLGSADEARKQALIAALHSEELDILLEIPEDVFENNIVQYTTRDVRSFQVLEQFERHLTDVVIERRLAHQGLEFDQVATLTSGVDLSVSQITKSGDVEKKSLLAEWGLVFVFVMILYISLLTWGVTISRSILEEKGSRIIEVLLSSVEPRELLFGKVVGIGLAGLTQMAIWSIVGLALTAFGASAAAELLADVKVSYSVFVYFILYFLLGFLLYASMFTVIGAICSTEQDAQQLQGLVTMPMIIPILVLMFIVQSPNNPVAVVLSLIPLFTPMVMLGRIIVFQPASWQIALSIGLMVASIYLSVAFSAKVFRVGILMYGKRPSLPEVIKWYRSAG